jgi:transcription antitermination protein NusB
MQALFEREQHPGIDAMVALKRDAKELGEIDASFAEALLEGVLTREEEVKASVCDHAPEWPMDRMDPISRAILLLGAFELLYGNDAPQAVVMNEAIEIAKEYGTEESGKFVNGVLNAIAHAKK